MRDRPEAARLLVLAQELEEIAPMLPPEQRVDPALLARARAIAEREREAGDAPVAARHRALVELYGEGDFQELFERLAREIRAGTYDAAGAERDRVVRLLWAVTLQKLSESNPDYLAASARQRARPPRTNASRSP
jgi:hypothetical protein